MAEEGGGSKKKTGRPSRYEAMGPDMLCQKVVECGQQGMSEVEMAVELGVPRRTMQSWADQYDDFSAALSRAKEASQAWWERQARLGGVGNLMGQVNPAAWKHVVNCRFRADYAETQNLRVTGKDGGPVQTVSVTMTPKEAAEAYADTLRNDAAGHDGD